MHPIFELPIRIQPRPLEMIGPYLARFAEANVLGLTQFYGLLRVAACGTPSNPSRLADEAGLKRVLAILGEPQLAEQPSKVSELVLRNSGKGSFKQVCPVCLQTDQPITHGLAEKTWAICFVHRVAHVTHCPACQRRLSWTQGSYFHCSCGFDLREVPSTVASPELCEFLSAVSCDSTFPDPKHPSLMAAYCVSSRQSRLQSTFAYFNGSFNPLARGIPLKSAQPTTPVLRCWMDILRALNAAGSVEVAVRTVESRLALASGPKVKSALTRRARVTWTHLRNNLDRYAIQAEQSHADCQVRPKILVADQPSDQRSARRSTHLSDALRAVIRRKIADTWCMHQLPAASAKARVDFFIDLSNDLRQLRNPDWIQPSFEDVAELVSLIACGVLTPWGPNFMANWHLRKSHVERVLWEFNIARICSQPMESQEGVLLQHAAVFDPRASVSDWLDLSEQQVANRTRRLLLEVSAEVLPDKHDHSTPNRLRVPYGFSFFLRHSEVRLCSISDPPIISRCYLASSNLELFVQALVAAWRSAKIQLGSLEGWAGDSARASQYVLQKCGRFGNPVRSARATEASTGYAMEMS